MCRIEEGRPRAKLFGPKPEGSGTGSLKGAKRKMKTKVDLGFLNTTLGAFFGGPDTFLYLIKL